jgi:hypothetical protein
VASWKHGNHLSICLKDTGKPRKPVSRLTLYKAEEGVGRAKGTNDAATPCSRVKGAGKGIILNEKKNIYIIFWAKNVLCHTEK